MPDWPVLCRLLQEHGIEASGAPPTPVRGGDISAAWRLDTANGPVFLKTDAADGHERLVAEADGLRELAAAETVRVPRVLACLCSAREALLALEWLTFERPDGAAAGRLGQGLAGLHRQTADRFGWFRDNAIGRTPQRNARTDDWTEFFRERRLNFQLALAERNGFGGELQVAGRELADGLGRFFHDYQPLPSLLHGDLWGGNWAVADGVPVIFDPAVYYGDRETDIAMTRLFGGFGSEFYEAYEREWPLADGHEQRSWLYQLYHVLNHLNLFGGSYHAQALSIIRRLNAG